MKGWTQQQEDELRALYKSMTAQELAIRFGKSKKAVSQKAYKLGLRKEQPTTIHLSDWQLSWLKTNYPHISTEVCAMVLGISHRSVTRLARRYVLFKTDKYMQEAQKYAVMKIQATKRKNGTNPPKGFYSPNLQIGRAYQFKPGHKPIKPTF